MKMLSSSTDFLIFLKSLIYPKDNYDKIIHLFYINNYFYAIYLTIIKNQY